MEVEMLDKKEENNTNTERKKQSIRIYPLHPKVNEAQIYSLITEKSNIKPKYIICKNHKTYGKTNKLRGCRFALVKLENEKDANICVEKLSKHSFFGHELTVNLYGWSLKAFERTEKEGTQLFLTNLPPNVNETQLREWILNCCNNNNKYIPKSIWLTQNSNENNRKNGYNGFAIIEFNNLNITSNALKLLLWKNFTNSDTPIYVRYTDTFKSKRNEELKGKSKKLLISNLPHSTNEEDIKKLVKEEKYGKISNVKMWSDNREYPRCIVEMLFENVDFALKAFNELHNYNFHGHNLITSLYNEEIKTHPKKEKKQKKQKKQNAKKLVKQPKKSKIVAAATATTTAAATPTPTAAAAAAAAATPTPTATTPTPTAAATPTAATPTAPRKVLTNPTNANINKGNKKLDNKNKNAQKIAKNIEKEKPKRIGGPGGRKMARRTERKGKAAAKTTTTTTAEQQA